MDMRAHYVAPAFGFQKNFPYPDNAELEAMVAEAYAVCRKFSVSIGASHALWYLQRLLCWPTSRIHHCHRRRNHPELRWPERRVPLRIGEIRGELWRLRACHRGQPRGQDQRPLHIRNGACAVRLPRRDRSGVVERLVSSAAKGRCLAFSPLVRSALLLVAIMMTRLSR
jgi:hypothetical protein